jgi:hypothetical protein
MMRDGATGSMMRDSWLSKSAQRISREISVSWKREKAPGSRGVSLRVLGRSGAIGRQVLYTCMVGAIGVALCRCEGPKRTPTRYLIPNGYVGWVQIDYEVDRGLAPEREGKYLVLRVPANGHLITSAHYEEGWASDDYFYYDSKGVRTRLPWTIPGRGGMVWGQYSGRSNGDPQYGRMFIGTEEQYRATSNDPLFGPPPLPSASPKRNPRRYLIPNGYVGWVEIDYLVEGGMAPEREGFCLVLRVPANGHLLSSAPYEEGWVGADEYLYYDAKGARQRLTATPAGGGGMVWGVHNGFSRDHRYARMFIGSESGYLSSTAGYR